MLIKKLSLVNFRNFHKVGEVYFPPDSLLVAAAPNATGKTNFMESIAVALRGKSFRANMDQCVQWGEAGFSIKAVVTHDDLDSEIAVHYQVSPRKFRIEENGEPVSPVTFYSHYPLIMFLPDDTFMFDRGPSLRRNFFNNVLVVSPQYLAALVQYHRALRQRNAAIKNANSKDDIKVWTDVLVSHAAVIWEYRQALVDFINQNLGITYKKLFNEEGQFEVKFLPGAPNIGDLEKLLADSWQTEKRFGYTAYGPHRDDMEIITDGKPIQAALSRGQTRGVVIALKVSVHSFMKQITGKEPLMLLDEILSELDEERQISLLEGLPQSQILLTCTSLPSALRRREDVKMLDLSSIINNT